MQALWQAAQNQNVQVPPGVRFILQGAGLMEQGAVLVIRGCNICCIRPCLQAFKTVCWTILRMACYLFVLVLLNVIVGKSFGESWLLSVYMAWIVLYEFYTGEDKGWSGARLHIEGRGPMLQPPSWKILWNLWDLACWTAAPQWGLYLGRRWYYGSDATQYPIYQFVSIPFVCIILLLEFVLKNRLIHDIFRAAWLNQNSSRYAQVTERYYEECYPNVSRQKTQNAIQAAVDVTIPSSILELLTDFSTETFPTKVRQIRSINLLSKKQSDWEGVRQALEAGYDRTPEQTNLIERSFYATGDVRCGDFFCVTLELNQNTHTRYFEVGLVKSEYADHADYAGQLLPDSALKLPDSVLYYDGVKGKVVHQLRLGDVGNERRVQIMSELAAPVYSQVNKVSLVVSGGRMWIIIDGVLYDPNVLSVFPGHLSDGCKPGIEIGGNADSLLIPFFNCYSGYVTHAKPDATFNRVYLPSTRYSKPAELPVFGV